MISITETRRNRMKLGANGLNETKSLRLGVSARDLNGDHP